VHITLDILLTLNLLLESLLPTSPHPRWLLHLTLEPSTTLPRMSATVYAHLCYMPHMSATVYVHLYVMYVCYCICTLICYVCLLLYMYTYVICYICLLLYMYTYIICYVCLLYCRCTLILYAIPMSAIYTLSPEQCVEKNALYAPTIAITLTLPITIMLLIHQVTKYKF